MIERTFKIEETEIEVTFQWDSGDRSAGIPEGWGEDTGVVVKAGPIWTYIAFVVDIDKPVGEWPIDDIQTNYRFIEGERIVRFLTLAEVHQTAVNRMSDIPVVCERVEETWQQVQAIEALERAGEDIWAAEEEVYQAQETIQRQSPFDDLDRAKLKLEEAERHLEEVKRTRDRLKDEYKEKYEEGS